MNNMNDFLTINQGFQITGALFAIFFLLLFYVNWKITNEKKKSKK